MVPWCSLQYRKGGDPLWPWPWAMVAILNKSITFLPKLQFCMAAISQGQGHLRSYSRIPEKGSPHTVSLPLFIGITKLKYILGGKCINVIFLNLKLPPFAKFKVTWGHLPLCNADYPNIYLWRLNEFCQQWQTQLLISVQGITRATDLVELAASDKPNTQRSPFNVGPN